MYKVFCLDRVRSKKQNFSPSFVEYEIKEDAFYFQNEQEAIKRMLQLGDNYQCVAISKKEYDKQILTF